MTKLFTMSFSSIKLKLPKWIFISFILKNWKLIMVILLGLLGLVLLFGFVITFLLVSLFSLCALYNLCDLLLYNPDIPSDSRVIVATPTIEHEVHYISTLDKVKIYVQLIKQTSTDSKSAVTVIYLHGNAGNVGHRLANAIEMFNVLKCNILLVEYRGYGFSTGSPSESGLYQDALAAFQFLQGRDDICNRKIILFGRSLGGAVAIGMCDLLNQNLNDRPMALILENTFTSVPEISRILCSSENSFLFKFIRMIPSWFYKNQFDSLKKISKINLPALLISGVADEVVPSAMMYSLFQSSGSCFRELHMFEGGDHNFTWRCPGYYKVIENFLLNTASNNYLERDLNSINPIQSIEDNEKSPLISCHANEQISSKKDSFIFYHSLNFVADSSNSMLTTQRNSNLISTSQVEDSVVINI